MPQLRRRLSSEEAAAEGQKTRSGGYFDVDEDTGGTQFRSFDDNRNRTFGHAEIDTRSKEQKRAFRREAGARQAQQAAAIRDKGIQGLYDLGLRPEKEKGLHAFSRANFLAANGLNASENFDYDWERGLKFDKTTSDQKVGWVPIEADEYEGKRRADEARAAGLGDDEILQGMYRRNERERYAGHYGGALGITADGKRVNTVGSDPNQWYYSDEWGRNLGAYDGAAIVADENGVQYGPDGQPTGGPDGPTGGGPDGAPRTGGVFRAPGGSGPFVPGGGEGSLGGSIDSILRGILEGDRGRALSSTVVNALEARAKQRADTLKGRARQQIDTDAVRRGVYRSPGAADQRRRAEREIDADLSREVTQIGLEQARTEFGDRMQALDRAQAELNAQRQDRLARETNAIARERIRAEMTLAERRIQAERANLERELASRERMSERELSSRERLSGAELSSRERMSGADRSWQSELDRQRWERELPFRQAEIERLLLGL